MSAAPQGFTPLFRSSPFLELLGPIYNQRTATGLLIGLCAQEKHCNARGLVHGGVFSSLADVALGYNSAFTEDPPTPLVTTSLTIDYAGTAKLGDWIVIESDVQKVGKTLAFANCYFSVGAQRIARASAVFSVIAR
jgi:acyl-coenzyme A thioesterase 13